METKDLARIQEETKVCPFCGEKPNFDYGYVPAYMQLYCINQNCHVRPSLEISVKCNTNSDWRTCTPLFSEHISELLEKWNARF